MKTGRARCIAHQACFGAVERHKLLFRTSVTSLAGFVSNTPDFVRIGSKRPVRVK